MHKRLQNQPQKTISHKFVHHKFVRNCFLLPLRRRFLFNAETIRQAILTIDERFASLR